MGRPSGRLTVLCGAALGVATFAYLLAWPPTLNKADESYTLYGAKRVFQGEAMYHDFFDFIAPGSIYLYAAAYAVGGVSITTARVTTALLHSASAVSTYALALLVASPAEALLAGLLVVAICFPTYAIASHHWVATSLGLASAAVLLAPRWSGSARLRPAVAGLLAGMLVSSHQGRGIGMMVWLALVVPVLAFVRGGDTPWRRVVRELTWVAAGGAVACGAILGFAVWRASLAEVVYATRTWVLENYRSYHRVGVWPWAAAGGGLAGYLPFTWHPLLRAEPWLMTVEGVLITGTMIRHGVGDVGHRTAVLALAAAAAASIMYFPDYMHVAIVTPYVLVVLASLAHRVRSALPATRAVAVALGVVWVAALGIVLQKMAGNYERAWNANPTSYATAYGTLASPPHMEEVLRAFQTRLRVDPARPPRVFAYPGDAWLYLTLPADNPTRYALLRPAYSTRAQIDETLATLRQDREAHVVVNVLHVGPEDPVLRWIRFRYFDTASAGPDDGRGGKAYHLFAPMPWIHG